MKTKAADIIESENGVTLSISRRDIALEADWEIEELAIVLATNMFRNESRLAIRGCAARILELSRISMAALGDTMVQTDALMARLTLEKADEVTA